MALLHRIYDDRNSGPVLVLTATGNHDVSRLVQLLTGDTPNSEQRRLASEVVTGLRAHAGGRSALELLAVDGGPDLANEDVFATGPAPAPAPAGPGAGRVGETCWIFAMGKWRSGRVVDASPKRGLRVAYISRTSDDKERERWFRRSSVVSGALSAPVTTFCAPCNLRWTGEPGKSEQQLRDTHNERFHLQPETKR